MQIRSPFSPYLGDCLSATVCVLQQRFRPYSFCNSRHAGHEIKVSLIFFFSSPTSQNPLFLFRPLFVTRSMRTLALHTPLFLRVTPPVVCLPSQFHFLATAFCCQIYPLTDVQQNSLSSGYMSVFHCSHANYP